MIRKVAVLPFQNTTNHREAGEIVTDLFVQELFNTGMLIVEDRGNIQEFFIRQRIRKKGEVDLDTIKMLGMQLQVDGVILGIVEEYYQEVGTRGESSPKIGLSVRMLNTKTGKIVWKCHHEKTGDDYIIILNWGKVRTVNLLAQKVIREMIATMRYHEK